MESTGTGIAAQDKLLKLTRKRLERFVTFVAKFLVNDDAGTIHDLRVWSRRLQQTLRSLSCQPKPRASRKLIKILRRVRQALGALRNLDVNMDLAQNRLAKAQSAILRDAWAALRQHWQDNRGALLAGARKEVAKYDLVAFIERAQKLLSRAGIDLDPTAKLEKAVMASLTDWDDARGRASENRSVDNLHSLRIATKRLRYRAEILAEVATASMQPMVKDLKEMQSTLGDWHDRSVLVQSIAEFIAQPDFLAAHPEMGSALLGEMAQEKKINDEAIEDIVKRIATLRKRWALKPAA